MRAYLPVMALVLAGCKPAVTPTAEAPACTSYPKITNVAATAVDTSHVKVTWTTDCAADSLVTWAKGGDDNPGTFTTDIYDANPGTTTHAVTAETGPVSNRMAWVRSRSVADPTRYGLVATPNISTTPAPTDGAFDYGIGLGGSHQVFVGGTAWINYTAGRLQGSDNGYLYVTVTGLPPNSTLVPDEFKPGCAYTFNPAINEFRHYRTTTCGVANFGVATSARTPPGRYTLSVNYRNAVPKTAQWDLVVERSPEFKITPPTVYPAIPCLNQYSKRMDGSPCSQTWQSQMMTYGAKWCQQEGPAWEGAVWYYDGTRVYYNVRDWDRKYKVTTNPDQWTTCIEKQNQLYRDYVNSLSSVTGYRVFPHGLAMHYREQGDDSSKQALLKLRNAAYNTPKEGSLIGTTFVRELSYRLETEIIDTAVIADGSRVAAMKKFYDISLGRADQYLSGAIELQPFMTGLWFESLITCYESKVCPGYQDPRIPTLVKRVADFIWPYYGITSYHNAWPYYFPSFVLGNDASYYNSVNMLTQFVYAWLWSLTGDPVYQQRADRTFEDGVLTKPGDGCDFAGKNYSQQYRLSFASVAYRSGKPSGLNLR